MSEEVVIGVDLGGTNVRARAVRPDGTPIGEYQKNESLAQQGLEATLDAVVNTIKDAIVAAKNPAVKAVSLAVPGHVDDLTGVVHWAPNFGRRVDGVFLSWREIPLKRLLEEKLDLPVRMGNDANLAALGEYLYGSGKGTAKCMVLLTMGTGIGGAVIFRGQAAQGAGDKLCMWVGGNGGGAELGHSVILYGGLDTNAGNYGSIEAYCQRDAIVTRAQHRLKREQEMLGGRQESKMWSLVEGKLDRITPQIVATAAKDGDEIALEIYEEVGTYLGVGVGNYVNIFAPDVVAIGGQIAKAGDFLLSPVRKAARNVAIPTLWRDTAIVPAELLDEAGILGAAALAFGVLD